MGRAGLAAFIVVFLVASSSIGLAAADDGNRTAINITGNMSVASFPSAYITNPRITSGSAISTIDSVTAGATLKDSFPSQWIMMNIGLDLLKTYEITYTVRLNYLYGICPICWWVDFSPIKEKTFTHRLSVTRTGQGDSYNRLYVYRSEYDTIETYDYNPFSPEDGENWAENLMNNLNDVAFANLGTENSGLTYAVTIMAHGYGKGILGGTLMNYDTAWANSYANPLVITVTNPPDPDIRYLGSRQYRLDGAWYSFSTPIKIKLGQSKNLDFYVTNIGGGPTSNSGYVSMSVNTNLDVSDRGGSYSSKPYPPGSQLSGACNVPSSQYKLLDTWTTYSAGDSRYIYTKLAGNSKGDGWVKVRAAFDTPASGMNTVNDPRTGETSEQDQQCFPVFKIPVNVRDCFADSDCPADGWTGSTYCQNNDVWQLWRDYYCNANGDCSYTDSGGAKQDCGDSYCDAWQNAYCSSGNQLWHKRNCYDKGCSGGSCFSSSRIEDVKIQDCPGKTDPWSSPYCAGYTEIDRSRWVYDGLCAGTTPETCTYKAVRQETEVVESCADYCGPWSANYCKAGGVYHSRTCHDKGCNTGDTKCYDNVWTQEEKVSDCAYGCDSGQCVACASDDNCGSWEGSPECCHMEGLTRVCGNLNPLTDDSWQMRNVCVNAGRASSYCTKTYVLKQQCNGTASCGSWSAGYCINNSVYQSRMCYDNFRCDNGLCGFTISTIGQKLQDCPEGTACSNGTCVTTCTDECSANQTKCNGNVRQACGNYDGDSCLEWPATTSGTGNENCSSSGFCSSGSCTGCQAGMSNCNQNASDGCEVNITSDSNNCGSCGNACSQGQICSNGSCITPPSCAATNISCGVWPNCLNCRLNDGCSGDSYRYYYCSSNAAGCAFFSDSCTDCSCSCGGYNMNETAANGNCKDGRDNDCDGFTDITDTGCKLNGDINGDSRVDILDLATVGLAFGSKPGDGRWNPNADVTGDGRVDIFDLATVGLNYGRSL